MKDKPTGKLLDWMYTIQQQGDLRGFTKLDEVAEKSPQQKL
jgi:hypothetical protein